MTHPTPTIDPPAGVEPSPPVPVALKGCPFCGEDPESWPSSNAYDLFWVIGCEGEDCSVRPVVHGDEEADAAAKWNRRA